MVRLLENESEYMYEMKRKIVWRNTETRGRKQVSEWQTWEATREDVRTVSEWRRVKECSVGKEKKRVRRRAREACHSSVNEERSLWEPLSSNSPIGQPHTHILHAENTHKYLFMLGEHAYSSNGLHMQRHFYMLGQRDGRNVFTGRDFVKQFNCFTFDCFTLFIFLYFSKKHL